MHRHRPQAGFARSGLKPQEGAAPPPPWWRERVVYQIYPRSFADGNGDGIGDLAGITARLDHLVALGVGALWLSPIFPSPMADFGYDVSDYCDIDACFGSLADFDHLLAQAHARDMKVIVDWVPNHTSIEHPWFVASRSSRQDRKRDWYIWRDAPANNWLAEFAVEQSAWAYDEGSGQYYLHSFLPEQPDLNWDNPEVRAAMADTVRFWLDRGVDGFRCDVVHLLGKELGCDDPPDRATRVHTPYNDVPVTHERLRELRRLFDSYPGDRMMVGEVFLVDPKCMAAYYGAGDELHLSFNFRAFFATWDATDWRERIEETIELLAPIDAWPTWVLSNHDFSRHRSRFGGSESRARAAAVLLVTLWGTPFLYQGEELGLCDAEVAEDRRVDPGGRDKVRTPIPWTDDPGHGWPAQPAPWLPFGADAAAANVARQEADPDSVLAHYRRLLTLRRECPALRSGDFAWLPVEPVDAPRTVLAYTRGNGVGRRWVVVNFGSVPADVVLPGPARVLLTSARGGVQPWDGTVARDTALILEPSRGVDRAAPTCG